MGEEAEQERRMRKLLRDIVNAAIGGCLGYAIASAFTKGETAIGIAVCCAFAAIFVREYLL